MKMLLLAALLSSAADKPLEQRFQAPQKGDGYSVTLKAPQLAHVNEALSLVLIVTATGDAALDAKAPVALEAHVPKACVLPMKGSFVKAASVEQTGKEWRLTIPFQLQKTGTVEGVLGVPVKLAGKKVARVAVPFSVTAEAPRDGGS